MSTKRKSQLVEVRRIAQEGNSTSLVSHQPVLELVMSMPVIKIDFGETAALAKRPSHAIAARGVKKVSEIPTVKIALHDGCIMVNEKKVYLPIGLSGRKSAKSFKEFAGIYGGNLLFVHGERGMQRVRDSETIEITPDAKFTHRRPAPRISSRPRYGTD